MTRRRYFYDTEFIEDGRTVELVSIGIVDETGRAYYAVSTDFDPASAPPWVCEHVLPRLPAPGGPQWRGRERIRDEVAAFLTELPGDVELWAWMGAYDHVVLAQLFGAMPALPRRLPRFTRDLRQLWESMGCPPLPPAPPDAHDALADARHNLARWHALVAAGASGIRPACPPG